VAEWVKERRIIQKMTTATIILGVTLSTLHQAGLGGLFLTAPSKIHPLWYSSKHPGPVLHLEHVRGVLVDHHREQVHAQVSPTGSTHPIGRPTTRSSSASRRVGQRHGRLPVPESDRPDARPPAGAAPDPDGLWYLVEVAGFTLLPWSSTSSPSSGKRAARPDHRVPHGLRVVLNRMNISVIAFKWYEAVRYYPSWMEIWVTLAVISMELWVFQWVINRMPILGRTRTSRRRGNPQQP